MSDKSSSNKTASGKAATGQQRRVVDMSAAREQYQFARKEHKLDALRERFSRALGMAERKPAAKLKKALSRKKKK